MNSRGWLCGAASAFLFCWILLPGGLASRDGESAQLPQELGQWSAVKSLPLCPIHAHLLPTGKVMLMAEDPASAPLLWDPDTEITADLPRAMGPLGQYAIFCSGHAFLADGRLLVTGGHVENFVGEPHAATFDPFTASWNTLPDMNAGRWYPTNTALGNGDILVVSGDIGLGTPNTLPEVWQAATASWRDLTSAQLNVDMYPEMFLAPNGQVINVGPSSLTRSLDTSGKGSWTAVAHTHTGYRDYGSAVSYAEGRVLILGGGDPPTAAAEILDLNAPARGWVAAQPMAFARRQLNATVLPDGTVLVTGGVSESLQRWARIHHTYPSELWYPAKDSWRKVAGLTVYRGYHAVALLLPDGRVFSAGGNVGQATYELYSPPYLFQGPRPAISAAPGQDVYGGTFYLQTSDAGSISQVNLVRLGSVTHTFNQEQQFRHLEFRLAAGGLNITLPSNENLLPPGYYMLFIISRSGVPSVAHILQVGPAGQRNSLAAPPGKCQHKVDPNGHVVPPRTEYSLLEVSTHAAERRKVAVRAARTSSLEASSSEQGQDSESGLEQYHVTELTALRGDATARMDSEGKRFSGTSLTPKGSGARAFFWDGIKGKRFLGTRPGGDDSRSFSINRMGHIVGSTNTATGVRAFLWTEMTGMRDIGALPGDLASVALGVSDSGEVVGFSSGPSGVHAFLWSRASGRLDLGTLRDYDSSLALAVNSRGHVVGESSSAHQGHAFLWTDARAGMEDLGTLKGDAASRALSLNRCDQVVGSSTGQHGTRAFRWTRQNGMQQLRPEQETSYSEAEAINDNGDVVGTFTTSSGSHAFLWSEAGNMKDLNALIPHRSGVVLSGAFSVSARGSILAYGNYRRELSPDPGVQIELEQHSYLTHAFLLTPNKTRHAKGKSTGDPACAGK